MARETASGKYYYRNATPITAAQYTIAAWAYTTSATANQNVFTICRAGRNTDFIGLTLNGAIAGDFMDFYSDQTGTVRSCITANSYTANAWNHCCGVAASSTDRKSYLNGDTANKGTSTLSSVPSLIDRVAIGTWFGSVADSQLFGGICECALWNAALTEPEVVALSKGVAANRIRPQSLRFYFPGVRNVVDLRDASAIISVGSPGVIAHPRLYQ